MTRVLRFHLQVATGLKWRNDCRGIDKKQCGELHTLDGLRSSEIDADIGRLFS